MTALNFITNENYVAVSTDTLSLSADSKQPYKFLDKAFLFPQMNCIVAGTGNFLAILHWVAFVREYIFASDIYSLNDVAKRALPDLMAKEILNDDATATIYQFGLSELDDNFHGYAYRSTNSFKSETIEYGLGFKPTDAYNTEKKRKILFSEFEDSSPEAMEMFFINLMCKQKEYDDRLPQQERLGIGGRIQLLLMTKDLTYSKCLYTFPDFEDDFMDIAKTLK